MAEPLPLAWAPAFGGGTGLAQKAQLYDRFGATFRVHRSQLAAISADSGRTPDDDQPSQSDPDRVKTRTPGPQSMNFSRFSAFAAITGSAERKNSKKFAPDAPVSDNFPVFTQSGPKAAIRGSRAQVAPATTTPGRQLQSQAAPLPMPRARRAQRCGRDEVSGPTLRPSFKLETMTHYRQLAAAVWQPRRETQSASVQRNRAAFLH